MAEKNTLRAFERAFSAGFGIETDLRDCDGSIVVSHDAPKNGDGALLFEQLLELYCRLGCETQLALNIKADGLAAPVIQILKRYSVSNYFVFDMSVPDTLSYLSSGARTFTRWSEFEAGSSLDDRSDGLWLDAFVEPYVHSDRVEAALRANKPFVLVSPELHKKAHEAAWRAWQEIYSKQGARGRNSMMICTDMPDKANKFFRFLPSENNG
jgi:hypothetical protein